MVGAVQGRRRGRREAPARAVGRPRRHRDPRAGRSRPRCGPAHRVAPPDRYDPAPRRRLAGLPCAADLRRRASRCRRAAHLRLGRRRRPRLPGRAGRARAGAAPGAAVEPARPAVRAGPRRRAGGFPQRGGARHHRAAPRSGRAAARRPGRRPCAGRPRELADRRGRAAAVGAGVERLDAVAAQPRRLHAAQEDRRGTCLGQRPGLDALERLRLRRRHIRRRRPGATLLLADPSLGHRRARAGRRTGRPHVLAVVTRSSRHGPAVLPRRAGPGHLGRSVGRPGDHLRGLRTRLRGRAWHRPHLRTAPVRLSGHSGASGAGRRRPRDRGSRRRDARAGTPGGLPGLRRLAPPRPHRRGGRPRWRP